MIRNYFIFSWRSLTKQKFFSALNVFGLSIAIAFVTLIAWYGYTEWIHGRNITNADNQYIIQSKWKDPNQGLELTSFGPMAKQLALEYPTLVKNYYRWDGVTTNVSLGDKVYREGLQLGDSTLFTMFGFTLLAGDEKHVLDHPYSTVITEEGVKKYFKPSEYSDIQNIIGKKLTIENFNGGKHDFTITGVLKTPASNPVTHLLPGDENSFYVSTHDLTSYFGRTMESWLNQYIVAYIELQPTIKPEMLSEPMHKLLKDHTAISSMMTPYLVNLQDYNLNANNGLIKKTLYGLEAIAFFILLMAMINFVNLSLSRATSRLKEIGIRKTMGSMTSQLSMLFMLESFIVVTIATIIGITMAFWAKPIFENILNKTLIPASAFPISFALFPSILIAVISVAAGLYPSISLASLHTVDSLKGKMGHVVDKAFLRKSLLVLQYTTAIIVFIGTLFISYQIRYAFTKDLGFDKEYIVYAQVPRDWTQVGVDGMRAKREMFAQSPFIKSVTLAYEVMDGNHSTIAQYYNHTQDSTKAISGDLLTTDEYFAETYDVKTLAGVFFNHKGQKIDSTKIVINESTAKALGYTDYATAIGQSVLFVGSAIKFEISGVVKDFNFGSIKTSIKPMVLMHPKANPIYRFLSFKLYPGDMTKSLAHLQDEWNKILPGAPFEYKFMDQSIAKLYAAESQLQKASVLGTLLSIIIVLVGIIGLVSIQVQKRTKEIGIRKIVGAPLTTLLLLLSKEFVYIILLSSVLGFPMVYILITKWLQSYAYRIEVSFVPFLLVLAAISGLTLLIIVMLTIRTAVRNPVDAIRTQ